MYRFYFEQENKSENEILIFGDDSHHIKNVLRLGKGEKVILCDGAGLEYECEIAGFGTQNEVICSILGEKESENELGVKIVLYQGLPKKDKMELIIQKAVELGAYRVVPVVMKRSIAKIEDEKSEKKKIQRWQEISRAAAKQSGRGIIPEIGRCLSLKQAIGLLKSNGNDNNENSGTNRTYICVAYENARGMKALSEFADMVKSAPKDSEIAVFIGPEGGFEEDEVNEIVSAGGVSISLGHRILRTETAGLSLLSILMYELETGDELLS